MKILKIIGGIFVALVIIGVFVGDDDTDKDSSSKGTNTISLVETKRPQQKTRQAQVPIFTIDLLHQTLRNTVRSQKVRFG